MWPDYSCCDFCILDESQCENCQARESERLLNQLFADLDPDWEGGDQDA